MSPVWILCSRGDIGKLRGAISRGEDINKGSGENQTGLICALRNGHNHVVELLLAQPSLDLNSVNKDDRTAAHAAIEAGNVTGLRMLLRDPRLTSVNARDRLGQTPLMNAVMQGRIECARELLTVEGVDLETRLAFSLEEQAR